MTAAGPRRAWEPRALPCRAREGRPRAGRSWPRAGHAAPRRRTARRATRVVTSTAEVSSITRDPRHSTLASSSSRLCRAVRDRDRARRGCRGSCWPRWRRPRRCRRRGSPRPRSRAAPPGRRRARSPGSRPDRWRTCRGQDVVPVGFERGRDGALEDEARVVAAERYAHVFTIYPPGPILSRERGTHNVVVEEALALPGRPEGRVAIEVGGDDATGARPGGGTGAPSASRVQRGRHRGWRPPPRRTASRGRPMASASIRVQAGSSQGAAGGDDHFVPRAGRAARGARRPGTGAGPPPQQGRRHVGRVRGERQPGDGRARRRASPGSAHR